MRNPWERNLHPSSSSKITGAAVADTVAYPQLTGDKPTKRQLKYAYLTDAPEHAPEDAAQEHNTYTSASSGDSSSSLPNVVEAGGTMTQEHNTYTSASSGESSSSLPRANEAAGTATQEHNTFTSAASGLQGGISIKKDWSPADDAETCSDLAQQDRVRSQPRRRLACCTELGVDGELTEEEPVAQKPSTTGTANLSATTHGSSSEQSSQSQHKHQDDGSTGAADNEPTTGTATRIHGSSSENTHRDDDERAGADDNAAWEYPVAYPPLSGEKQRKKQTRNAHLAPRP